MSDKREREIEVGSRIHPAIIFLKRVNDWTEKHLLHLWENPLIGRIYAGFMIILIYVRWKMHTIPTTGFRWLKQKWGMDLRDEEKYQNAEPWQFCLHCGAYMEEAMPPQVINKVRVTFGQFCCDCFQRLREDKIKLQRMIK